MATTLKTKEIKRGEEMKNLGYREGIIFFVFFILVSSFVSKGYGRVLSFQSEWKVEKEVKIPAKQEVSFSFPAIPKIKGKIVCLRIQARLHSYSGCSNCLAMWINDKPVYERVGNTRFGKLRLLNRTTPMFHSSAGEPYFKENRLNLLFWTSFESIQKTIKEDRDEAYWYLLDVSDLINYDKENKLTFKNTANPKYFGNREIPIVMGDCEIGYVEEKMADETPLRRSERKKRSFVSGPSIKGPNFVITLVPGGGMEIKIGENLYFIESDFSYPYGGYNKLLCASETDRSGENIWKVSIKSLAKKRAFEVIAEGKYYTINRTITLIKDHLQVKDKITNLTQEPLGIIFKNSIAPLTPPKHIYLCGMKDVTQGSKPTTPLYNPTAFFSNVANGLGVVVEDTVYRLQLNLFSQGKNVIFSDSNFGLPPSTSYTLRWSIYPINSNDYYDFINKVREDWGVNFKIEGPFSFGTFITPDFQLAKDVIHQRVKLRGAKILAGWPWLNRYWYKVYQDAGWTGKDTHAKFIRANKEAAKKIDPSLKILTLLQTLLIERNKPGEAKPLYPDSVEIGIDGEPVWHGKYTHSTRDKETFLKEGIWYHYYPTLTNSYYKKLKEWVEFSLNSGADGVYFDTFSYASCPHYGRYTYDRWDNHTVDIDPETKTIIRKKADLCLLSEDARLSLVNLILSKGGIVYANNVAATEKFQKVKIYRFIEAGDPMRYSQVHLSTPIILGWYKGYKPTRRWETEADLFDDIKMKLSKGCLYAYYATPRLHYPMGIMHHMYPITPMELHAGWIKGKERIITLNSGNYGWGDKSEVKCFFYDKTGKECKGKINIIRTKKENIFQVEVPEGGAVVLERVMKN